MLEQFESKSLHLRRCVKNNYVRRSSQSLSDIDTEQLDQRENARNDNDNFQRINDSKTSGKISVISPPRDAFSLHNSYFFLNLGPYGTLFGVYSFKSFYIYDYNTMKIRMYIFASLAD